MLKIVFFTFYYPPDLSAGSFRAGALARALVEKLDADDELHIITTHPNRYASYRVLADDLEKDGALTIHRIILPENHISIFSQAKTFAVFAFAAYKLCKKINPNFLIGTTSRLMTGVLTSFSAVRLKSRYYIDLRDIFSETLSNLLAQKNRGFGVLIKHIFTWLERRVFNGAAGVNVVSHGFPVYFQSINVDTTEWSFFPNGVDQEFIGHYTEEDVPSNKVKTILYAGNIGSGQGLEKILPHLAKRLVSNYNFLVVGDGGTALKLRKVIHDQRISNIEMVPPVDRKELLHYYKKADILFLHLNDVSAFERVLPSKIFEYAALGKPIVAGLSGYSEEFMQEHVSYASIFQSGDVDGACVAVIEASEKTVPIKIVNRFVTTFSRKSIMNRMANHLLLIMREQS